MILTLAQFRALPSWCQHVITNCGDVRIVTHGWGTL
jgi:hypothetical protein